ncbi:MAG: patatin-like phospholipase family protein [Thermoproteota archaeon]|nr:patatin-like phospholipase family protein [Thermoproteota archaeon]
MENRSKGMNKKKVANSNNKESSEAHRVLVLQGGGALGAYEAGVFDVLYYWIKKDQDITNPLKRRNIFDVVAGTSIGAINAAILVSYVKENNGSWEGSTQKLLDFWEHVSSTPDLINYWPYWSNWPFPWDEKSWMEGWNRRGKTDGDIATGEAARRYYSAKEFLLQGAPNFISPPTKTNDNRFLDDIFPFGSNIWYKYSNKPLTNSIKKFVTTFPIATDVGQPRLLLVSVDVKTGTTVTFDSYSKPAEGNREDQIREYKYENHEDGSYDFSISYDEGIMPEHLLASASVPVNFDYTHVPTKYDYSSHANGNRDYSAIDCNDNKTKEGNKLKKITTRCCWDGGLLSNSPLREVISAHKLFWELQREAKHEDIETSSWNEFSKGNRFDIPNLQVYIVDLWPSKEEEIPIDHDKVLDRKNDITYQNKTDYDQKVAVFVSDYIDLVEKIGDIAVEAINSINDKIKKNTLSSRFNSLLVEPAKSKQRDGEARKYQDLIKGRFDLDTAFHLERKDDPDTISNKWFDLSKTTIKKLIEDGRVQTLMNLYEKEEKENDKNYAQQQLRKFIDTVDKSREDGEIESHHADFLIRLALRGRQTS